MAENAQEDLEKLLDNLRDIQAHEVSEQITTVIARGKTEEIETKGKIKERSQRPLEPDEAYTVAVEMLIASLEPLLMKKHIVHELAELITGDATIVWQPDFIEASPISPEIIDNVDLPDIEGIGQFEVDLKRLLELLEDV